MSELVLVLGQEAYELWFEGRLLGILERGAASLLRGAGPRLRELDVETAIERAEEWIMPLVARSGEKLLRIEDRAGRVRASLPAAALSSQADVELAFTRAFDAVAFGRPVERELVGDLVVLRELVHHANVTRVAVA